MTGNESTQRHVGLFPLFESMAKSHQHDSSTNTRRRRRAAEPQTFLFPPFLSLISASQGTESLFFTSSVCLLSSDPHTSSRRARSGADRRKHDFSAGNGFYGLLLTLSQRGEIFVVYSEKFLPNNEPERAERRTNTQGTVQENKNEILKIRNISRHSFNNKNITTLKQLHCLFS